MLLPVVAAADSVELPIAAVEIVGLEEEATGPAEPVEPGAETGAVGMGEPEAVVRLPA